MGDKTKRKGVVFGILYDVALAVAGLLSFPRLLYLLLIKKKYRRSFKERFGFSFPSVDKGEAPLVWVHAVSMGEAQAAAPLVRRLKEGNPHIRLLWTSVTETGYEEAQRLLPGLDAYGYLPLDFSFIIRPLMRRLRPDLLLITESDLWYHFQHCAKEVGAALVLVNGKLSQRSQRRHRQLPWLSRRLVGELDHLYVQSETHRQRFCSVGVDEARITVTGNLKFDSFAPPLTPEDKAAWRRKLGLSHDAPVVVLGSTHPSEEDILLDAFEEVWKVHPTAQLVVVPRHPERFGNVAKLLEKRGLPYVRYSEETKTPQARVFLVDAMGLLKQCYQLATLAVVCGTFTDKVGGHNLLEPVQCGVPVLYGPHTFQQPDMVELLKEHEAGVETSAQHVAMALTTLLEGTSEYTRLCDNAVKLMQTLGGGVNKIALDLENRFLGLL